jgi:hypothetical protein
MKFLVYTILLFVPMPYPTRMQYMWPTPTWGIHFSGNILYNSVCTDTILQGKPNVADPHTFKIPHCIKFVSVKAKSVLHYGYDVGL